MSAPELTAHRLGRVDRIPVGEGRAFAVGEEQVAVFRLRSGALHAIQAVRPHAGGPLADAQTDGAKIACPSHNYAFTLTDAPASTGSTRCACSRSATTAGRSWSSCRAGRLRTTG